MLTKTPSKNYAIAGFPGCPGTAEEKVNTFSRKKNDLDAQISGSRAVRKPSNSVIF
jgi:hypothetical protein